MAAASDVSDIEKSFTFLQDNVPPWFKTLDELEEKITRMQEEVAKLPASRRTSMKRKTGSIESIRDLDRILEAPGPSTAAQQPFSPLRRPPASLLSGQTPYRSRTMIIVYYDGQIQKQFEGLVRSIGSGRNLLRKGKMAARMEALTELASSDDDNSEDDDDLMSKIQYRRRTGLSSMRAPGPARGSRDARPNSTTTPEALFDSVDKALEQAQALCERAAHQSLRDGHCRKELEGMRKHFQEILEKAKKEVARLTAQKAKQQTASPPPAPSPVRSYPVPHVQAEPKQIIPVIRPLATYAATSKAMDIEIDDDDDDDVQFIMPPVRLTSRG